jgi:hypothetical protein
MDIGVGKGVGSKGVGNQGSISEQVTGCDLD